jgi:ribonuclease-3 family protein
MILNNGESLAYLGDSVYELLIRKHVLAKGIQDVNKLHKEAVKYTSGEAQAKIVLHLLTNDILTEEEISYYKRGRNSSHSKNRRNIKVSDYKMATGFEALIGFLSMSQNEERINELVLIAIKFIEEGLHEQKD